MGLVPSLQPAKPAVRLGGTHVLWARCRARVSGLFWGRTGDGTQGLGHGRHTLCPWVHLPHFVLLTRPAWVLGKLFFQPGFLIGVPGSHWLLQGWAGLEGRTSEPGTPVRVVCVVPGPPPCSLLTKLRCNSCLYFPPAPTASGCSRNASPWLTLLPAPVTVGGAAPLGKKQHTR